MMPRSFLGSRMCFLMAENPPGATLPPAPPRPTGRWTKLGRTLGIAFLIAIALPIVLFGAMFALHAAAQARRRSFGGLSTNDALIWGYGGMAVTVAAALGGWLVAAAKRWSLRIRLTISIVAIAATFFLFLGWLVQNLPPSA
jgi:hypothetical protein